jgi:hypothetical protein
MDFGKSFTFMFEDPRWIQKFAIGIIVGLVGMLLSPILIGFIPLVILLGYTVDVVRNVIDGKSFPMPEWEDWGGFFVRGLKLIVSFFVWTLPIMVVTIPLVIGASLIDADGSGQSVSRSFGLLLAICAPCLMILWGLFVALISPAIYIRLAATGRLGATFEIGRLWALTSDNLGSVIIALLLTIVAGLIASVLGSLGLLFLVIGMLVTIPAAVLWQYLVQAHLFGQIGRSTVTPME